MFTPTSAINNDALEDLRETVNYWRRFIPEDGMKLDKLVSP